MTFRYKETRDKARKVQKLFLELVAKGGRPVEVVATLAQLWGLSTKSIYRYLQDGNISIPRNRDKNGRYAK